MIRPLRSPFGYLFFSNAAGWSMERGEPSATFGADELIRLRMSNVKWGAKLGIYVEFSFRPQSGLP